MAIDRSYIAENNAERKRLRILVERMSDADLAYPLDAGWTIAAVLAHLAFWDARILHLLDKWERGGAEPSRTDREPKGVDWINDAAKPLCLALPPREAARLAVAMAEETDRRVEALSDELIAKNKKAGSPVNLWRAEHRREHLDDIGRYLAG
jgi:hypothetical protein